MPENSEKIYQDEQIGPVRLCKSARARRIIVRVHPIKGVSVTVPRWMPYAAGIVFFRSRRDWVLAVLERQRSQGVPRESLSEEEIEAMRAQAKRELPPRLAELAALHGFAYNRVFIKNNASNWGSCSAKGNINLNLSRFPRPPGAGVPRPPCPSERIAPVSAAIVAHIPCYSNFSSYFCKLNCHNSEKS